MQSSGSNPPPATASRARSLAAWRQRPESGPRIVLFSGGSAMREASRVLKRYTHNSIHLITPFDSGGSSAALRAAFCILGVGDLRNRMVALADESERGRPEVNACLAHRLSSQASASDLVAELDQLMTGDHALMRAVPESLRGEVCQELLHFAERMPLGFDLRDASVGNLWLVGALLSGERDLDRVLRRFSELVRVCGEVRPTALDDVHLVALHADSTRTVGQHLFGKQTAADHGPIRDIELTSALEGGQTTHIDADPRSLELILSAQLICFPMGSFFGSVLANLLPRGVGSAVLASEQPRVFIPNAGEDPEMRGYSLAGCVEKIAELVGRDANRQVAPREAIDWVLIDSRGVRYGSELDKERLEALG
ncbi:MAG: GAK system CofD-like protein, partial [bacterium]